MERVKVEESGQQSSFLSPTYNLHCGSFCGLTNFILRNPKGNPQKELNRDYRYVDTPAPKTPKDALSPTVKRERRSRLAGSIRTNDSLQSSVAAKNFRDVSFGLLAAGWGLA